MPRTFVDTNILFHSVDGRDPIKQERAIFALQALAVSGEGRISTQVAMEFAVNVVKKLGYSPAEAERLLQGLSDYPTVPTNVQTVQRALSIMGTASISFWDAAIMSAAEAGGCEILYSEDLQSGQVIAGVTIVNPLV